MMKEIQEGDINAEDEAARVSKTVERIRNMRERIRKTLPDEPQRKPVAYTANSRRKWWALRDSNA